MATLNCPPAGKPMLPQPLDNNLSWTKPDSINTVKPVSTLQSVLAQESSQEADVFACHECHWLRQDTISECQPQSRHMFRLKLARDRYPTVARLIQPPDVFATENSVRVTTVLNSRMGDADQIMNKKEGIKVCRARGLVEEDLVGFTESILTDYANLISSVADSLRQSKVNVDSIIAMITEKQKDSRCSKLYEANDMIQLFLLLKKEKYVTFFNHSLLVDIIQEFGDEKCEFVLRQFKAKFQSYCRNRVVQIPRSSWSDLGLEYDGETTSDQVEIVFKIDECFYSLSAERLHLFGGHVAKALGIDESMLILKSVKEGCVMVSYLLLVANIGELLSRLKTYYFYHEDYESQKTLSVALIFSLKNHCDYRNLGFQMQLEPRNAAAVVGEVQ